MTTLHDKDERFLNDLRDVGLLPDLAGEELTRAADKARAKANREGSSAFRMDLLEAYYAAHGNEPLARTRRLVDRFFVHHEGEGVTASMLLERLSKLAPEVGKITLERIGSGDESTLVLRAGDDFVALLDEDDAPAAGGDLDTLQPSSGAFGAMVTVRGLIRAVNVLLGRRDVRERLMPLRSDVMREVYVAIPLTEAIQLARNGHLEEQNAEDVMELGGW